MSVYTVLKLSDQQYRDGSTIYGGKLWHAIIVQIHTDYKCLFEMFLFYTGKKC